MEDTKKLAIFNDKNLKPEFKRVLKSALKSKAVMHVQTSEIEGFFNEEEYQAVKIKYSDAALKDVKSVIRAKVKNKNKVLAVLKGNKSTTLDHLDFIWISILNKVSDVSWGYYVSGKYNNSLYLFIK